MEDHFNQSAEGVEVDEHFKQLPDPSLEGDNLPESNGNGAQSMAHGDKSNSTPHHRNGALEHHRYAKRLFTEATRTAQLQSQVSPLGTAEPRRLSQAPIRQTMTQAPTGLPGGRVLPSRDVTDDTIDDAYVAFILYCNPTVPLSVDTAELKRGFRMPPKSDGKSFHTFKLFELIRQLEKKEIKSWSQLALLLGVEPPIAERKQSAQKVQQYAVRLKRWMHAMHLDAFFAYCIGRPHIYYSQIPISQDPHPESERDGVPLEEDLALRALHPESRPKRGRKKAEEKEAEGELSLSPIKRPRLETSLDATEFDSFSGDQSELFATNTVPSTAHNDEADHFDRSFDPWTGTPVITTSTLNTSLPAQSPTNRSNSGKFGGQQFRWRLNAHEANTPATPYPQSAITPHTSHLPDSVFAEPLSAITPASSTGRGKGRRRHGPAVSSAWPSGGNALTGKFRGRPPSNRSIRDGPFTTFPANPRTREGPVIDVQRPSQTSTPITERIEGFGQDLSSQSSAFNQKQAQGKKTGLQLQVPERSGGTVRLATPAVLVNGEGDKGPTSLINHSDDGESDTEAYLLRHRNPADFTSHQENELVRCLATRLSKTVFVMGSSRLDFGIARRLAENAVGDLKYSYKDPLDEDGFIADCALWFGLAEDLEMRFAPRSTMSELRVLPADPEHNADTLDAFGGLNGDAKTADGNQRYVISWRVNVGPLSGSMALRVSLPRDSRSSVANIGTTTAEGLGEQHWKMKFLKAQQERDEEVAKIRRAVMNACF